MALYDPHLLPEAQKVKPELAALIVHRFLEKVQEYSQNTIRRKWGQLQEKEGKDQEILRALDQWLTYHAFNAIALHEIEDGTLDEWFPKLFT